MRDESKSNMAVGLNFSIRFLSQPRLPPCSASTSSQSPSSTLYKRESTIEMVFPDHVVGRIELGQQIV
jgi:hypothetical protein